MDCFSVYPWDTNIAPGQDTAVELFVNKGVKDASCTVKIAGPGGWTVTHHVTGSFSGGNMIKDIGFGYTIPKTSGVGTATITATCTIGSTTQTKTHHFTVYAP